MEDGEHPEDPEREDRKWMRTAGIKRKTVEQEEEETVKYLKTLERTEAKKESQETLEVVEAEVDVNEEEVEWRTEGETQFEEERRLGPGTCREEMNYMVITLGMFGFGMWQEGTSSNRGARTTTKWIDRVEEDADGREFVRWPLVASDFKPRREGPRDELSVAIWSVARVRGKRQDNNAHVHRREASALQREM